MPIHNSVANEPSQKQEELTLASPPGKARESIAHHAQPSRDWFAMSPGTLEAMQANLQHLQAENSSLKASAADRAASQARPAWFQMSPGTLEAMQNALKHVQQENSSLRSASADKETARAKSQLDPDCVGMSPGALTAMQESLQRLQAENSRLKAAVADKEASMHSMIRCHPILSTMQPYVI